MKKDVLLLSSCDAWHSRDSFRTIGIFSTFNTLFRYLKKYDKLTECDIFKIIAIGQTQGREVNYCVERFNVNPK